MYPVSKYCLFPVVEVKMRKPWGKAKDTSFIQDSDNDKSVSFFVIAFVCLLYLSGGEEGKEKQRRESASFLSPLSKKLWNAFYLGYITASLLILSHDVPTTQPSTIPTEQWHITEVFLTYAMQILMDGTDLMERLERKWLTLVSTCIIAGPSHLDGWTELIPT